MHFDPLPRDCEGSERGCLPCNDFYYLSPSDGACIQDKCDMRTDIMLAQTGRCVCRDEDAKLPSNYWDYKDTKCSCYDPHKLLDDRGYCQCKYFQSKYAINEKCDALPRALLEDPTQKLDCNKVQDADERELCRKLLRNSK